MKKTEEHPRLDEREDDEIEKEFVTNNLSERNTFVEESPMTHSSVGRTLSQSSSLPVGVTLGKSFVVNTLDDVVQVYTAIFGDMKEGLSEFVTPMLKATESRIGHINSLRFAYEKKGILKRGKGEEEMEDRSFKLWKTLINPRDDRFRIFIFEAFKVMNIMC